MSQLHVEKFKQRSLSWSSISSFEYNPQEWALKYLEGKEMVPNKEMIWGNVVGGKLSNDPSFLLDVPRYKIFEHKLEGRIGDIHLTGYIDSFCPDTKHFYEYKTSSNKKRWTKKTAQEHGQLQFYKFLIYLNYKVDPKDIKCKLVYIPVEENGSFEMQLSNEPIQSWEVLHNMADILKFAVFVKNKYNEMIKHAEEYQES